jgi:RNA-binding protein YhbY
MEKPKVEIPVLLVGKNGVTDSFLVELQAQLRKFKTVKVRMLKASRENIDRRGLPAEIAVKMKAELIDARGYTFTLKKR